MRVFIAGGAGVLGRRLIPKMIARGHEVVATTRSADRIASLTQLGAEAIVMDGLDASSVGAAVAKAAPDAVIHQMTALSGRPDLRNFDRFFAATNALRTTGTRHLLSAAQACGVRTFIAQSFTGWPNSRNVDGPATEGQPLEDQPLKSQARTLAAIQELEHLVSTSGLDAKALRYGSFFGAGATDLMVRMIRKRMMPLVGEGKGVMSWIHLEDAADATIAALYNGPPGLYNIVDDDPAPAAEWLPFMASVVGAPEPLRIPSWLARLIAGEAVVRMMNDARGSSNAKARHLLDWSPRWSSWRDGFTHALFA